MPPAELQLRQILTAKGSMVFCEIGDDDDDPLISAPMIRRTVSAADAEPLPVRTGGFIFDLADLSLSSPSIAPHAQAPLTRIERTDTGVRCTRILPQDTAEWQERERARRARQRPPKPTQRAKTMSEKMRAVLDSERL